MKTLLDLLIIGIIIICAWTGYKKGIIMGMGGIIVIIIAVFGANLLSNTFSYEVIPAMKPFVGGYMEKQVRYSVFETLGIELPSEDEEEEEESDETAGSIYSTDDLLADNPEVVHEACVLSMNKLGITGSAAEIMASKAEEHAGVYGVSIPTAIIEVLCEDMAYAAGFILAFLIIAIALTVVGNVLNFSFKIPGLDIVNGVVGAVLGVVTGIMLCAVLAWALKFTGLVIKPETLEGTHFLKWFMEKDILTGFIGL